MGTIPTGSIPLDDAQRVLAAAVARAAEIGQPMNVAVVDDGAHLVAFARMDGAIRGSIDISIKKARTAVLFDLGSADLMGPAQPGAPLYGIEETNGGLVVFGGGLRLTRGGALVGAVGVSAGTVDEDVDVASAGVAAL